MALLWADGFDHYGLDETNMTDGVYAQAGATLSSSRFNTGTHSIFVGAQTGLTTLIGLRKVLPSAKDKLGMAARFYFATLPQTNGTAHIFSLLTSNPQTAQLAFIVDSNGCIRVYRGRGTAGAGGVGAGTQIAISDPIVVASAWNHIEVQAYIHDTLGWVRVAVNGVHRFAATGLNTKYNTSQVVSVAQHQDYLNIDGPFYMDDYFIYDFVGTAATDTDFVPAVDGDGVATNYIGELQCMYLPPNGNTAEDDWAKSTGTSAFAVVDEVTPDDADYLSSTTAGDLTEMDLTDLPEDITYVRGLQLIGRMSKSDSGAARIQYGMNSDGTTDDVDEIPITTEPTYWWDYMNVDPDSSARWTRASLNAAKFRITRSV